MSVEEKTGYIQTDVGLIPMDWSITRVDADALIKTGSKNTQDRMEGGEYPFFVRSQKIESIDSYSYDGEAVLTAGDGVGTGKVFHYINGKFDVHQRVYRISDFSSRLSGRYFFYQFSSRFYDRIMSMTAKSSVDSVRMEMIGGMEIPLPPINEQRAIAVALDDMNALISGLDQFIAKKRDIKQATMQQLLTGHIRLPGFSGEWEVKRLEDIAPLQRGFDLPNPSLRQGQFPVVYSNGILNFHNEYQVKAPGVVTGRSGTIGNVTFIESDFWPHNTSLWVTSFKGNDPKFVFYLYKWIGLRRLSTGSGVPTLNRNDVHAHSVNIPPSIEEQSGIAATLSDMDTELATLESRRDKAKQLKQGMMQELLTGRIRFHHE